MRYQVACHTFLSKRYINDFNLMYFKISCTRIITCILDSFWFLLDFVNCAIFFHGYLRFRAVCHFSGLWCWITLSCFEIELQYGYKFENVINFRVVGPLLCVITMQMGMFSDSFKSSFCEVRLSTPTFHIFIFMGLLMLLAQQRGRLHWGIPPLMTISSCLSMTNKRRFLKNFYHSVRTVYSA